MPITKSDIQDLTSDQSYSRGWDYFNDNYVIDVQKRGNTLLAEVEGSGYEPYRVTVELSADKILSTSCTCPYDWGGICKHIVAVLLSYLEEPEQIIERPSVEELLADRSQAELREIVIDLLQAEPYLIEALIPSLSRPWSP